MSAVVRSITPAPPYDLAKVREVLTDLEGEEPSPQRRTLLRGWMLDGQAFVVRLEDVGTVWHPQLEVELISGDAERWTEAEAVLRRSLSLDLDLRAFEAQAAEDPPFLRVLEQLRGYHPAGAPTPFEAAAWAILSQHTYRGVARAAWSRLVDALGTAVVVDGRTVRCSPDPGTVLARAALVRDLLPRGRTAARLLAAAEVFREELAEREVAWMDPRDVRAILRTIPGVGPWSCASIAVRGYGHFDELPVVGPQLLAAVRATYGAWLDDAALPALAQRYAPLPGCWAALLSAAYASGGVYAGKRPFTQPNART